jgi:hypothetical protein
MHDFTVRNSILWNHGTGRAFKLGTEFPKRRYSRFNFENCDVIHSESLIELTWENDDGEPRSKNVAFEHIYAKNLRAESPFANRTIQVCCGEGRQLWFQNLLLVPKTKFAEGNGFRHETWGGGRVWSHIEDATIQHLVIGESVAAKAEDAGLEHDPKKQAVRFLPAAIPQVRVNAERLSVRPGDEAVFTLRRTGEPSNELCVQFQFHGSAIAGRDFAPLKTVATFAAGASQTRLKVPTRREAITGSTIVVSLVSEMSPHWAVDRDFLAQITIHPGASAP